jgi:hypothetical protein
VSTATLAASAASFHPVNPATRIGRSSSGRHSKLTYLLSMELAYHALERHEPAGPRTPRPGRGVRGRFPECPLRGRVAHPGYRPRGGRRATGAPAQGEEVPVFGDVKVHWRLPPRHELASRVVRSAVPPNPAVTDVREEAIPRVAARELSLLRGVERAGGDRASDGL